MGELLHGSGERHVQGNLQGICKSPFTATILGTWALLGFWTAPTVGQVVHYTISGCVWGGDLQCTVAQVLLPIFPISHILIFGSEVLVAFGCKPEMLVGVACVGDPV